MLILPFGYRVTSMDYSNGNSEIICETIVRGLFKYWGRGMSLHSHGILHLPPIISIRFAYLTEIRGQSISMRLL